MILVTGASGFVGSALVRRLVRDRPGEVRAGVRNLSAARVPSGAVVYRVPDLGADASWAESVAGCHTVVHAAARVHVMQERAADPLAEFRRVNVEGTMRMAQDAIAGKVRRIVFVSSVKVLGEMTHPGMPFVEDAAPHPVDAYGVSKLEAEARLADLCRQSSTDLVIVRPPLVYGPGVGASFRRMVEWVARGVPLPLASVDNRRSLVALDNLVDALSCCVDVRTAPEHPLLVSDGEDLSTPELLRRIALQLGRNARLLPMPTSALLFAAGVTGMRSIAQRLLCSLQVDISGTRRALKWSPPVSVDAALSEAVREYRR